MGKVYILEILSLTSFDEASSHIGEAPVAKALRAASPQGPARNLKPTALYKQNPADNYVGDPSPVDGSEQAADSGLTL